MDYSDSVLENVAKLQQQNIEQERRLKNLERNNKAIVDLTYVTKELAETVKQLAEIQEKHDKRIDELERAPGENLLKLKNTVVIGILSALSGGIVTLLIQNIL